MAWIIICTVAAFVYVYMQIEEVSISLWSALMGCIVGMACYCILGGMIGSVLPVDKVIKSNQICALTDNNSIEGRYYLYSGYINEKIVYRYVIETEIGKHVEEIDSGRVYIKEGNYPPTVKHCSFVLKKKWHYWFANTSMMEDYYVFYVPESTVTGKYNIDLK